MKPTHTLALITPGAVSGTAFARFPAIARLVTHIVAPTYRQASRVANTMYFAEACRTPQDARDAFAFLICDAALASVVELLVVPDWNAKVVLLALPEPDPIAAHFRELGASVAVVTVFDEVTPCHLFVEGDSLATTIARQMFQSVRGSVSVTAPGSQPHLEAMRLLAGPILMGVLESANLHLRRSGMPLDLIRDLLSKVALQTLRVHQRSGARTLRTVEAKELAKLLVRVADADPSLAAHLHASESATRALLEPYTLGLGGGKSRAGQTD